MPPVCARRVSFNPQKEADMAAKTKKAKSKAKKKPAAKGAKK
jgi:hypothetical protein